MKVDWKRSRGHTWPAVREEEVDGIWFAEIRVKLGLTEKRVWLVCVDIIVTKGGFQWTVGHRFFNCGFRSSRAKLLFLIQGYWCPRELCTVRASQGAIADHSQRWKITPKILFLVLTNVSSIFVWARPLKDEKQYKVVQRCKPRHHQCGKRLFTQK